MENTKSSSCLFCSKPLKGRTDKKYCDDQCRSAFNNQQKSRPDPTIKTINARLLHNRNVLRKQLGSKVRQQISRQELERNGFLFPYHTHALTTTKGTTCSFCYEYGYQPIRGDRYLIIKQMVE